MILLVKVSLHNSLVATIQETKILGIDHLISWEGGMYILETNYWSPIIWETNYLVVRNCEKKNLVFEIHRKQILFSGAYPVLQNL